jgi:hypothetical protein
VRGLKLLSEACFFSLNIVILFKIGIRVRPHFRFGSEI